MQPPITAQSTILEVTERFPATIQVLVQAGFPKVADRAKREALGRSLTVEAAARLRKLDPAELVGRLSRAVESASAEQEQDVTLGQSGQVVLRPPGDLSLSGLLPCPVRLPILEAVSGLARRLQQDHGQQLGWSLAAASVGADSLNREIAAVQQPADLPDLFISAGFESFFDAQNLRRFRDREVFRDLAPAEQNACFDGLELRDPRNQFTVLAVVPAVFLVNRSVLGQTPTPRSWSDLLTPELAGRVALPVGDFDLFNAILLQLYQEQGEQAVDALGRSMLLSLHPSQTVGRFSGKQEQQPAVSIVPYFFSRMTMGSNTIQVVWPEDGAIISPIFMLLRAEAHPLAREVAQLFLSREVGEVLAHRGLFPVLDPQVDNRLEPGLRFRWLGWPFIESHDLGQLIPELRRRFDAAAGGAS